MMPLQGCLYNRSLMATTYTIELPGYTPTPTNKLLRVHWGSRSRIKKRDYDIVATSILPYGIPAATGKRHVRMMVVLGKGQRAYDPDAYQKVLHDALVKCGLLKNDSKDWVSYDQPVFARGESPATYITLTDV